MIVDCHTHIWESAEQIGVATESPETRLADGLRPADRFRSVPVAPPEQHLAAAKPVDMSIVMGFRSYHLRAHIPNDVVAKYVRQHPDRLIGFAGIDPTRRDEAIEEMRRARSELGMRGLTIAPSAQDFHPMHSDAMAVYDEACSLGMPLIFHQGLQFTPASKMEYSRPSLLDDVAREFPNLRVIVAHLGYPWVDEAIVLVGKHANVFADISGLLHRPWQAYNALLSAYHYGVIDKLLFGSDFPYTSASTCIEALYSINHLVHGTNLPTIPREKLRGIVERDTLHLLGIHDQPARDARTAPTRLLDDEE
jgi:predicted TIM-barrel fold metal-dependent hydrolase